MSIEQTTADAKKETVLRHTVSPVTITFAVIFILIGAVAVALALGLRISAWMLLVILLGAAGLALLLSAIVAARKS